VSLGATLLNIGNQFESQVRLRSTLKSGIPSRMLKMASWFCSKKCYLFLALALMRIFRICWCFIAMAISFAFMTSWRGLNLGQVYMSHRIYTASMFPNFIASIRGVLPQGSSWFFSE